MKRNKLSVVIASSVMFASLFGTASASSDNKYDAVTDEAKIEETKRLIALENKAISNRQLSQTRMEILQKKLEQNLEKEELALIKAQGERAEAERRLNASDDDLIQGDVKAGSGSGRNDTVKDAYHYGFNIEEVLVEDYSLLSEKYNLEQNVGFVYKSKEELLAELMNSEEFKAMQNIQDEDAESLLDVEIEVEIEEIVIPPTSKITSATIKRISSFGADKTARIEFKYSTTENEQTKTGKRVVYLSEGSEFEVEYEKFKTIKIDSDGVTIRNLTAEKDMIVRK